MRQIGGQTSIIAKLPFDAANRVGDRATPGVPASYCHAFNEQGLALPILDAGLQVTLSTASSVSSLSLPDRRRFPASAREAVPYRVS